ncbi:DUF4328 domain-containing protein [Nocardioides sp. SYSU D00038]|uniref:DUF4328 domain-containing protein n=1 Tax=Nocardioides sp. SYSU D00038 TaxID=2812554 RepID=UPI00196839BC|nr:DUF4328 domain-containing protein [Nocardioides sp. SYSU D00038]
MTEPQDPRPQQAGPPPTGPPPLPRYPTEPYPTQPNPTQPNPPPGGWPPPVAPAAYYGAAAYGCPAPAQRFAYASQLKVPSGLAIAALILASALTIVQLALAATSFAAAARYREEIEAGGSAADVLTAYDFAIFLLLPVGLGAYALNSAWLYGVRKNAGLLQPEYQFRRSPVWAWLGWWVPIVSVWFPLQVVKDAQEVSVERGATRGLALWWTCWLSWIVLNQATGAVASSTDPDVVGALPALEVVATLVLGIALWRWIVLVRTITGGQEALRRR